MQAKVIKLVAIIGGIILLWILSFMLFGEDKNSNQGRSIEFWNVFDTSEDVKPLLEEFTANTGIKVNYRNFADLDEYKQTLLLELASGEGPDVLALNDNWIQKYKNLLFPLPTELGYSPNNVEIEFVDAVKNAVVVEEEIPESDRKKGRIPEIQVLGLPMYLETIALYYNQNLFRNVLSKAYASPELTWSGVRDDSFNLTVKDNLDLDGFKLSGIALGRVDNITRGLDMFYNIYLQFGGENISQADKERKRDSKGNSYTPLTTALDFFTGFANSKNKEYMWNGRIASDYPEKEMRAFVKGEVAMLAGYSYYYEDLKDLIEEGSRSSASNLIDIADVKISPIPQLYDPKSGNPKSALADFFALSVSKNSEDPYSSWSLILHLTSRESQTKYNETTKKPTSRRDLIETQKEDLLYGVFAEQAVYATTITLPDDDNFEKALGERINQISDGEINSNEAMQFIMSNFSSEEE